MPGIGDLLAQITGDKSAPAAPARPSPTSSGPRTNSVTKRKAEDDAPSSSASKVQRTVPPQTAPRTSRPPESLDASRPVAKPTTLVSKPNLASRPAPRPDLAYTSSRTTLSKSSAPLRPANGVHGSARPSQPSPAKRPAAAVASSAAASDAQPKKGSFKEILERARLAQAKMGQVGKIQHKPVERGPNKKEREEIKAELRSSLKKGARQGAGSRSGTSSPALQGRSGTPNRSTANRGAAQLGANRARNRQPSTEDEREKKVKKAATSTTGYQGTARPVPGAAKKKDAPRGGALLDTRPPRFGAGSRDSRYKDDYDEELDDFIDYDEEEEDEGPGGRRHYDSEGSSDMEAGLDDIDEEEHRAAAIARREDLREEREEALRKKAKEDRKRQQMKEARGGR